MLFSANGNPVGLPMHVLLLDLGIELRGGQRQVYYLARYLAEAPDISVLTACPANGALAALLRREGLPLLPLPGRSPLNPALLWTLKRVLGNLDVLHTHDANAATVGALCKTFHPALCLIHSRRVSYPLRTGARLWKYLKADACAGVSQEISDGMIRAGLPAHKVFTIHSGIDPNRYAPKRPRSNEPFLFQSIGACTPQKGYSVLLRAMQNLLALPLPPWKVRIVGDGPLRMPLLEEAQQLGVAECLSMPGWKDSREVLPDCDALVVPSVDGEGSSGAIKEGWVTGVPVICSSLLSNTELVQDGHNGLTATVGDPQALADAMRRCLLDAQLRDQLVSAGSRSVLEFTDKRMASAYLELYRRLRKG